MTTFLGNPVTLEGTTLTINDQMPDFEVVGTDLSVVRPMEKKGKKIILAVPSVDTGVCSLELGKFKHLVSQHDDVDVYSVSMDLPFALDRWNKSEENTKIQTSSDYRFHDFGKKTGTYMKDNGLLARAVFVTDENGKITHVEYVDEVSHEPNYQEALKAVGIEA